MNIVKNNYHTHIKLCNHAFGMPEDYIKRAIELNMEGIGISDHNPFPSYLYPNEYQHCLPNNMKVEEFYNIYLPSIEECQKEYGKDINIYKGLECEYIEGFDDYYNSLRNNLDYIGLGIHFFVKDGKLYNSYFDVDYKSLEYYVANAINAIDSGLFDIFYHPDVFMMGFKNKDGERKLDKESLELCEKMIKHAVDKGIYLEINANGIGNSKRVHPTIYMYPNIDFWKMVSKYKDAKIIIGCDAHNLDALSNENVEKAYELVEELGLTVLDKIEMK